MDLTQIAGNIEYRDDIWYSKSHTQISYPENANDNCFELENNDFFWFTHRNNCIVETVKQHISTDEAFFDIGGGNGYVSAALGKEGVETYLVEPGRQGIANAKKRGLKNLVCSSLVDANFRENTLPNIGLFDVIEHIEKDEKFLHQLFFYLKPGGKAFITVPAYPSLWSAEDVYAGHFRRYTLETIQKKLEDSGLKVIYKTYFFSFLPIPIFLFRTLPSLFKMKKKQTIHDKPKSEYKKSPLLDKFLKPILNWELVKIRKQERIPFGGSCLIVCIKP
ncbi:MAG: class I SAM-dependent methyltransferase [Bacteroidetes bacterium]|nr:class I SAM-dependent methyltransferase [Bacteroidota bacterium]